MEFVKGPDFPTGGVLVDDEETIAAAYVSGRGSLPAARHGSRSSARRAAAGTCWSAKSPTACQKAKLIEQIAELIADKKLPILADVSDESDEQVRLVLEPRARTVDPDLLLESLLPADRPRNPLPAQPQRARRDPHAGGDEPQGGAARLARLPDRGAGPPHARCGSARSTTGWSCSTASSSPSSTSTG